MPSRLGEHDEDGDGSSACGAHGAVPAQYNMIIRQLVRKTQTK